MVYLFLGQDFLSQETKLRQIIKEHLPQDVLQFNLDILYSKDVSLKDVQEKLICLPVKARKRVVVIKQAQQLKAEIKEFLAGFAKKSAAHIVLVLEAERFEAKDAFFVALSRCAEIVRFSETAPVDNFELGRLVDQRRPHQALSSLRNILDNGQKPELVLGSLRYSCERTHSPVDKRRKLRLLLTCDREMKTGRLKPALALEKLVVSLCYLGKTQG